MPRVSAYYFVYLLYGLLLHTARELLEIIKLQEFYLVIVTVRLHGSHQQCPQRRCACCVRVWMSRLVLFCSNMWSYAATLSVPSERMTDRCHACHSFPECCGWDVWGQGTIKVAEERDGEAVLSFHSGFSLSDIIFLILTPVLSISISRWLTKALLRHRRVHIRTLSVCVCVCPLTHKNNVKPVLLSACPHSDKTLMETLQHQQSAKTPDASSLPIALTHWLNSGYQNADCFPKIWFHKWKNSICFPTASHMAAIDVLMNWSR